jgi:low affinity Fe/Cu permease
MAKPSARDTLFTGPSNAGFFDRFAHRVTRATGSHYAFFIALAIVVGWGLSGPIFHYSDTWQLVINTGTTVVTFLMVFVIQQSQNKDTIAIQLKLNELIAATRGASNRLVDVEDLSDAELDQIKAFYVRLAARAKHESDLRKTHSLFESEDDDDADGDGGGDGGGDKLAPDPAKATRG